ncbi:magnesium transporter [Natronospirillum operosum]|uniref:Magnesium transporter MgtE n=1 Tax=Natronospirillum operosum TaxID=2759953 RepID=A0A4Z0WA47_9GAMM|nr:magnesium transporter [Natronospirillum operosum]TGG91116.1 magnesium transporter [Natronospirillum operosum]
MLLDASRLQEVTDQVSQSLQQGDVEGAVRQSRQVSALRLARLVTEAPPAAAEQYLRSIQPHQAGRIATYLPADFTARLLGQLDADFSSTLISEMEPEAVAHLMPRLPEVLRSTLFDHLAPDFRQQVEQLASYAEGSAGSVMSPFFLSIEPDATVREAIDAVRHGHEVTERTAYVFVVTPNTGKLKGVLSVRELLMADPKSRVSAVMTSEIFAVRTDEAAVQAARRIRSRRLKMFPVVDEQDVLVGVISIGQAMDLLAHEMADEFVAISAGSPDESFFTPPRLAIRKRLPWMAANIFLNLGAVAVISTFEETIVAVAILAAFLPMITDMGGNVGIQALSVSIRSIALGEARLRDFWLAARKEIAIGLVNGLVLGTLFCLIAYFLEGNIVLGIVAGIALGANVLIAGVIGGTIPFLIKRMGKDPAMMTGPVLTTITDITGVTIYLGLATLFLSSLIGL